MNKISAVFCLISISSSAFAMHAYGEDTCITQMLNGQTLTIGIANGQPADPHKIVDQDSASPNELALVEFRGAPIGIDEKNGALVLQSNGDKNIKSRKYDDGCFQGYERTSTRQATVISVSKKLSEKYGLSKGNLLNFVCFTSFSAPTGAQCK